MLFRHPLKALWSESTASFLYSSKTPSLFWGVGRNQLLSRLANVNPFVRPADYQICTECSNNTVFGRVWKLTESLSDHAQNNPIFDIAHF